MAPHGAPCGTFSKARRKDSLARLPLLRSDMHPEGLPGLGKFSARVREANLLATRTAALCKTQVRAGRFFSVENPLKSRMWDLPSFRSLDRWMESRLQRGTNAASVGCTRRLRGGYRMLRGCTFCSKFVRRQHETGVPEYSTTQTELECLLNLNYKHKL